MSKSAMDRFNSQKVGSHDNKSESRYYNTKILIIPKFKKFNISKTSLKECSFI